MNFLFQEYILSRTHSEQKDVKEFIYKSKEWRGWPGDLLISKRNGTRKNLSSDWRISTKNFFTLPRCYTCFDKLNELADISFGDNWLPRFRTPKGNSMFISRTKKGEEIVKKAIEKEVIKVKQISIKETIFVQKSIERKVLLKNYLKAARLFGIGFPEYNVEFSKVSDVFRIGESLAYIDFLLCEITSNSLLFNFLKNTPLIVLKTIAMLRRLPRSFIAKFISFKEQNLKKI
jgi:hypothetical protein